MQYGGSEAHLNMMRDGVAGSLGGLATAPGGVSVDGWGVKLFTSLRRYYSNAFTDRDKQDALNLMLGKFAPWRDLVAQGGAYRHIWEWNEDDEDPAETGVQTSRQESDHFLHNPLPCSDPGPPAGAARVGASSGGGGLRKISSASSLGSMGSMTSMGSTGSFGESSEGTAAAAAAEGSHGLPTVASPFYASSTGSDGTIVGQETSAAAAASSVSSVELPSEQSTGQSSSGGEPQQQSARRKSTVVDYKPSAIDRSWVRFEELLSPEWRIPVHVHAAVADGSDGGEAASVSRSPSSVGRRHVDGSDELWRQSSAAWIEQIGSIKLPAPHSSTLSSLQEDDNATVRDRKNTDGSQGESTGGWGTTPGTLRSILMADSMECGHDGKAARADDSGIGGGGGAQAGLKEGSRWRSVSAAAAVKVSDLDVIARLQRAHVTDQVAAEMDAALLPSVLDQDQPLTDLLAADPGGGEAEFFSSYLAGQRPPSPSPTAAATGAVAIDNSSRPSNQTPSVVATAPAAAQAAGGELPESLRRPPIGEEQRPTPSLRWAEQEDRDEPFESDVGYRYLNEEPGDQLYFQTYAQGRWLRDHDHGLLAEEEDAAAAAGSQLSPKEQAEREEQRWRVDNPRRRFQQQQRQQQQHAGAFPLQGIASARPNAADSDGSAAAAAGLWGLRWVEVGEPLPRWRSAEVSYAVRIPLSVLSHLYIA